MAPSIPAGVPSSLIAGTTWRFTVASESFPPAEGWALTIKLSGARSGTLTAATPAPTDVLYTFTVAADATVLYPAGRYGWVMLAILAGDVWQVDSGTLDIASIGAADGADGRVFAEKQLAAVEAEIAARFAGTAGSAHENYTIGGRSITKISIADLQTMRARLSVELERIRNGGALPPYEVTFGRPR